MDKMNDYLKICEKMTKQNQRKCHVSIVDGGRGTGAKYKESYGSHSKKVMLFDEIEIGCIVNHTPYSPDMDTSGSARVFKINPELKEAGYDMFIGLYAEDLVEIAKHISSVDVIPKNRGE